MVQKTLNFPILKTPSKTSFIDVINDRKAYFSDTTNRLLANLTEGRAKYLNTIKVVYIYHKSGGKIKMLTKKQLRVIDIFKKNLGKPLTFNQIKKEAKIKSNNFLHRALSNCMFEGIVMTQTVGKSFLYHLEINSQSAAYLGLLGKELYSLPDELNNIEHEVTEKTEFFIGLVFGSYAQNRQNKESDLDIAFIVPDNKAVEQITPVLESIKRKIVIKWLDYHIFTRKEFTEMLSSNKQNVGKEIMKDHLVFYNPSSFYYLIKPWIR